MRLFVGLFAERELSMVDSNYINKRLKKFLDKGRNKIVIFPFGKNGKLLKDMMKEYYDMTPQYIVDNEYCKYNEKIISFAQLKEVYDESMDIWLTAENVDLNTLLEKQLLDAFPVCNIVNLIRRDNYLLGPLVTSHFNIDSLIKNNYEIKERIKVRIFHRLYCYWNNVSSLCTAFLEDENIDLKIIVRAEQLDTRVGGQITSQGMSFLLEKDYDVCYDKPDVVILTIPWGEYDIHPISIRKNARLIVALSMPLVEYADYSVSELIKDGFGKFMPDYYLVDRLLYNSMKNLKPTYGSIIEMGSPKYDGIFDSLNKTEIPKPWKKIKGKRILLWTTDHGIYDGRISYELTFDLYAKYIFDFALRNKDIGLVFRPHPTLITELFRGGYWDNHTYNQLKHYVNSSENVVWDEFDSYDYAYSVADAIIVDGYCGMICSVLPLDKPVGVTYRSFDRPIERLHPDLVNNYYTIENVNELNEFLENVVKLGKDDKKDMRKNAVSDYLCNFDGKNGERIKTFVLDKIKQL